MVPALALLALVALFLAYGIVFSEGAYSDSLRAEGGPLLPQGLREALDAASGGNPAGGPEVLVFPDTLPRACVIRAPGRPGRILVSRGLAATFRDEELVAVFRQARRLLSQPGVGWKSACACWLSRAGRERGGGFTPLRALFAFIFFPARSYLERQARSLDLFESPLVAGIEEPAWLAASHRASRFERIFS